MSASATISRVPFLLTSRLSFSAYGRTILRLQSRRHNTRAIDRDTVYSVGILPKGRPYTAFNPIVRTFRHAVSLDERRAKFRQNLWKDKKKIIKEIDGAPAASSNAPTPSSMPGLQAYNLSQSEATDKTDKIPVPISDGEGGVQSASGPSVEEVWFSGCHCGQLLTPHQSLVPGVCLISIYICVCADVGGGSVQNDTPHSLARLSLRWMIRECFKANTGIMFKSDRLRIIGLDPASLYPVVRSRPPPLSADKHRLRSRKTDQRNFKRPADGPSSSAGTSPGSSTNGHAAMPTQAMTEEEHELHDTLSPAYDQLALAPIWWILEYLPLPKRYKRSDGTWGWTIAVNRGRARFFPPGMKVHRSVRMRMEAQPEKDGKKGKHKQGDGYVPRPMVQATLLEGVEWVD